MMNAPRGDGDYSVKNWTTDELKQHVGFMKNFLGQLKDEGTFVAAEGLAPPGQARIVRASKKDSTPEVTDGPYAEAKEFLAGYWIVDVESPEQAYAIAARASLAPGPGGKPLYIPVEVREVMSAPPVEP
ncbi:MAG TPA: YciI family protein [Polyangiaceae bacterium]|nr:YciI family protein [Polyangiaceae bacterium]